jgi:hypothetical protein
VIALSLGLLAAVSCGLLLLPAWRSAFGPWVTAALAVSSIAAGIVALERRHGRSAWVVGAITIAGIAGVIAVAGAVPQPDLAVHVYGYKDCLFPTGTPPDGIDPDSYESAFYAPALLEKDPSGGASLSFGTSITVAGTPFEGSEELAKITVGAPVDVTAAAGSAAPSQGAYLAVPVTIEAVNEGALDCYGFRAPGSYWVDMAGDATQYTTVTIPGYPTIEDGGVDNGDGTFTYYDIFDVSAAEAAHGDYELDLLEPDGTIQAVVWTEAS